MRCIALSGLKLDVKQVVQNMAKFENKFDAALYQFANNGAQKMEAYAKQNRPWTDRTGRARQSLKGSAYRANKGYRLEIAHGVSYGVYLEYAHERKFAILWPTVEKVGRNQILPAFDKFIERTCKI